MLHTAEDRTPYTYVIIHKPTRKKYYGCRYSKNCHPSDLWKKYFTSSKIIKKLIKEGNIDDWDFEIREVFSDILSCKLWEEKVLRRLKIPYNPNWFNQSVGGKKFLLHGEALENQKKIVSEKMKWLHQQPEYKEYRKLISKRRWEKEGAKEEHSKKIKEYWNNSHWVTKVIEDRKNRLISLEERSKMSERMIEVWHRPEYIKKHREAMKIVMSNPEWLDNNRKKQKEAWQDPIKRENRLKNRKPHTEERRKHQSEMTSEQNKKSWQDPIVRARRIEGMKNARERKKAAEAALYEQKILSE